MSFFRKKSSNKRYYVLLEVLVAIAIVSLAFLPLLTTQANMYRTERELSTEPEVDRVVSVLFTQLLERLYRKEIGIEDIPEIDLEKGEHGAQFTLQVPSLQSFGYEASLELGRVTKGEESLAHLIEAHFTFSSRDGSRPLIYTFYTYAEGGEN